MKVTVEEQVAYFLLIFFFFFAAFIAAIKKFYFRNYFGCAVFIICLVNAFVTALLRYCTVLFVFVCISVIS